MTILQSTYGGRTGARRLLVITAAAVWLWIGGGITSRANEMEPPQIDVVKQGRVFTVNARFEVTPSAAAALAVITDYESIPRFMPPVKTSIIRRRNGDGRVVVEQEAVSGVMMFSKRVHLLLDVRVDGQTVTFRDTCGKSFEIYAGSWRLSALDGATVIHYELNAKPNFDVPEFLLGRLMRKDAQRMIERLRAEIEARR